MHWLRLIYSVLKESTDEWFKDNGARLGAALAFYSILSIAPLLLIAVSIMDIFFDEAVAREHLLKQVSELVGREGAGAVKVMLESGTREGGKLATILGIATLIFGASGRFQAVW